MSKQLPLLDTGPSDSTRRANQISKRASKARRRLPVFQPELVADPGFTPKEGVPKTRGDCPKGGLCPFVKCRFNLLLEDAEHRAGRPGLSSVPRDARGHTLPVEGRAGHDRPGTTLRPAWLRYRGLEVEREVKVYIDRDGTLRDVRKGALDYWLARLHEGEPVLVFDDESSEVLARAKLTEDGLAMDRELPERVYSSTTALILVRVREVSSCALDEIERHGKMSNEQIGDAIARHRTLVAREVKRALGKAIEEAGRRGIEPSELMAGLGGCDASH